MKQTLLTGQTLNARGSPHSCMSLLPHRCGSDDENVAEVWALVRVTQAGEAPLFTSLPHSSLLDDHDWSNGVLLCFRDFACCVTPAGV